MGHLKKGVKMLGHTEKNSLKLVKGSAFGKYSLHLE